MSYRETYPPFLTVADFLLALRSLYPKWDTTLEAHLINRFNLDISKRLNHLSLGESSKVKLLKALAFRPELLILDELTANLSDESKKTILAVLIDLFSETDIAVLYISHSREEAVKLSDRILSLTPSGLTERGV